ncbi:MAG TPA: hypothetical protein VEQ41_04550, partial [Solirubrobacterales bacterium]|nr:hypothetical protein [Solirubrobacterales bacterium]
MRTPKTALATLLASLVGLASLVALLVPAPAQAVPRSFFGIAPQHPPTAADVEYMRAGRIGSLRWPLAWGTIQLDPETFVWESFDEVVASAARQRLRVLPFVYATPGWLAGKYTTLPVNNARQRQTWAIFLQAAVERYGPGGSFWVEHSPSSGDFIPEVPIRQWQVWNEANFFYFAKPASPGRYARLLKIAHKAIKRADPGAEVILSGLFAEPNAKPPNGMDAVDFLDRLYAVPGIKRYFESVALHPYSEDAATLRRMTEGMREVILDNRDRGARLYMTEMGWGSQNNPNLVSFEQGVGFQIREMRRAYRYLIANRHRLNLKGTYWFTWRDRRGACNFCDSTGFFRQSERLRAKPAWHAFVDLTGG